MICNLLVERKSFIGKLFTVDQDFIPKVILSQCTPILLVLYRNHNQLNNILMVMDKVEDYDKKNVQQEISSSL
mgnify:CR=1 FL=1